MTSFSKSFQLLSPCGLVRIVCPWWGSGTPDRTFPLAGLVNQSVHRFESGCLTLKLSLSWKTVIVLPSSAASAAAPFGLFPPSGEMGIVVRSTCSDMLGISDVPREKSAGERSGGMSEGRLARGPQRGEDCVFAGLGDRRCTGGKCDSRSVRLGVSGMEGSIRGNAGVGSCCSCFWEWKERLCSRQYRLWGGLWRSRRWVGMGSCDRKLLVEGKPQATVAQSATRRNVLANGGAAQFAVSALSPLPQGSEVP